MRRGLEEVGEDFMANKDGTKKAIRKIRVPYKYPSSEGESGAHDKKERKRMKNKRKEKGKSPWPEQCLQQPPNPPN